MSEICKKKFDSIMKDFMVMSFPDAESGSEWLAEEFDKAGLDIGLHFIFIKENSTIS